MAQSNRSFAERVQKGAEGVARRVAPLALAAGTAACGASPSQEPVDKQVTILPTPDSEGGMPPTNAFDASSKVNSVTVPAMEAGTTTMTTSTGGTTPTCAPTDPNEVTVNNLTSQGSSVSASLPTADSLHVTGTSSQGYPTTINVTLPPGGSVPVTLPIGNTEGTDAIVSLSSIDPATQAAIGGAVTEGTITVNSLTPKPGESAIAQTSNGYFTGKLNGETPVSGCWNMK